MSTSREELEAAIERLERSGFHGTGPGDRPMQRSVEDADLRLVIEAARHRYTDEVHGDRSTGRAPELSESEIQRVRAFDLDVPESHDSEGGTS